MGAKQIENAGKIIDYGVAQNLSGDKISIAVKQAFYESSLGAQEHNTHNSKPIGLFHYELATWKDMGHGALNIHNDGDQIKAIFDDIDKYSKKYDAGQLNGSIPKSLSFEYYFEAIHHSGQEKPHFTRYAADWRLKTSRLDFFV